jgi:subtilisin family serine protease
MATAAVLLALLLSGQSDGKSLGTYRGTFEIGRHPFVITKENLSDANRLAKLSGRAKTTRVLCLVDQTFSASSLPRYGWRVVSRIDDVVTLEGFEAAVPYLTAIQGIRSVELRNRLHASMDSARAQTHIDEVHGTVPSGLSRHFTGKGVVVGIVETEFDTHHPAFIDSTGGTRFVIIWDQNDTSKSKPNRMGYGLIKTQQEMNKDSLFAGNYDFHGTMVASCAAGSDKKHPFWGAAPDATLVGVVYGPTSADIVNAIQWIFSIADSLKKPCVVNLSIGVQQGPHDGTSLVDRSIDNMVKAGRIVVGAAGNDGDKYAHVSLPLKAGESKGTFVMPEIYYACDSVAGAWKCNNSWYCDIWGDPNKSFSDTLYIYDGTSFKRLGTPITTQRNSQALDTVLWPDAVVGPDTLIFMSYVERFNATNSKPHMEIAAYSNTNSFQIGMKIYSSQAQTIHAWNCNKKAFSALGVSGFYSGDSLITVDEVGGTAKKIITVGGYNSRVVVTRWDGTVAGLDDKEILHDFLSYTSLGPTVDGRNKPDITAPARQVIGAQSRVAPNAGRTVVWPDTTNTRGRYEFTGGTSVASPIVAGIVALMLQLDPTLTPDSIRSILQATAIKDQFTGNFTAPGILWGGGKVNAMAAIEKMGVPVAYLQRTISPEGGYRFYRSGRDRFTLECPASAVSAGATMDLFDVQGRQIARIAVDKRQSSVRIPAAASNGCFIIRVRWAGGTSLEQRFVKM